MIGRQGCSSILPVCRGNDEWASSLVLVITGCAACNLRERTYDLCFYLGRDSEWWSHGLDISRSSHLSEEKILVLIVLQTSKIALQGKSRFNFTWVDSAFSLDRKIFRLLLNFNIGARCLTVSPSARRCRRLLLSLKSSVRPYQEMRSRNILITNWSDIDTLCLSIWKCTGWWNGQRIWYWNLRRRLNIFWSDVFGCYG